MKGIFADLTEPTIDYLLETKPDFIYTPNIDKEKALKVRKPGIKVFKSLSVFCGRNNYEKQNYRAVNKNGQEVKTYQGWYVGLCPTNPDLQKLRLNEIKEAFNCPYIDGVWLDSIRYPTYWEEPNPEYLDTCYCGRCMHNYSASDYSWEEYRIEVIRDFIKKANELKGDKLLGYFAVPEDVDKLKKVFAQHPKVFEKYFDYATPMLYPQMVHKSATWATKVVQNFQSYFGVSRVTPIIQLIKMPENSTRNYTVKDLKTLSKRITDITNNNISYFALGQILSDTERLSILKKILIRSKN